MNLATAIPTHVLSVLQPWATGLVHACKTHESESTRARGIEQATWKAAEFRSWALPSMFIHHPLAVRATIRHGELLRYLRAMRMSSFATGAIVGAVWFDPPIKFRAFCGDYIFDAHDDAEDNLDAWIADEPGCPYDNDDVKPGAEWVYAWPVVKAIELPEPIAFTGRGNQGITLLPEPIRAQLADALAEALAAA